VALGLSRSVELRFPDWGPAFSALQAGVIMMNMLSGPPLFKVSTQGTPSLRSRHPSRPAPPAAARALSHLRLTQEYCAPRSLL
jgi:hypothetical protein